MSSSRTETVDVTMPQMGVSVVEGTVVEWKKEVGDPIAADESICDISTDKIDTEVPAPVGGTVAEIVVPVGETVEVGTVLARIATEAGGEPADAPSGAPPRAEHGAGASEAAAAMDQPSDNAAPKPAGERSNGAATPARRYSPVVTRIAQEHGVDLERVEGTGRGGRVRKQDVLAFVDANGQSAEAPLHIESPYRPEPAEPRSAKPAEPRSAKPATAPTTAPGGLHPSLAAALQATGEPLSRMRRSIGEHMKRSLDTAATCTTWIEVDFSGIEAARARSGLTALPYVARAAVVALREHPRLNAWLDGEAFTRHEEVNLGIAVSLGEDGLIVPVIHGAQDLSEEGLAKQIRDLARRARTRRLSPEDVRGGTFTITNPGQFGSVMATPVINQPQVAILDVEAVVKRAVVVDDAIAIRPVCVLGLSWDHRALDGVLAAQFLAAVRRHVEAL